MAALVDVPNAVAQPGVTELLRTSQIYCVGELEMTDGFRLIFHCWAIHKADHLSSLFVVIRIEDRFLIAALIQTIDVDA